jgi:hypothetical protein
MGFPECTVAVYDGNVFRGRTELGPQYHNSAVKIATGLEFLVPKFNSELFILLPGWEETTLAVGGDRFVWVPKVVIDALAVWATVCWEGLWLEQFVVRVRLQGTRCWGRIGSDHYQVARIIVVYLGRDTSVGIATRYGLDGPGIEHRWRRDFPHPSRPALGLTQPPIQWVPGLSRGSSDRGVVLTTHPYLAPRLRKE